MSSCKLTLHTTFISIFLVFSYVLVRATQPKYLHHTCLNNKTYAAGSKYDSNLRDLLLNLSTGASSHEDYSFMKSQFGSSPDAVYGLFLCRGDLYSFSCTYNAAFAAQDIRNRCPTSKEAIVWYNESVWRYSDYKFFGLGQVNPVVYTWNTAGDNKSNPTYFGSMGLIQKLIADAKGLANLYAANESEGTEHGKEYGLVQCTGDLNADVCGACLDRLSNLSQDCCRDRVGWGIYGASCMIKLDSYQFFDAGYSYGSGGSGNRIGILALEVTVYGIVPLIATSMFCFGLWHCFSRCRRSRKEKQFLSNNLEGRNQELLLDGGILTAEYDDGQEIRYLSLNTIVDMTNGFSDDNKLGEGGFGPVYKGTLPNGKDVAIKRLSKKSNQGLKEFKNEVILVIKLQHRNLVRLLGYCVEKGEKLLIYEYMPNKSLDAFLFDPIKCKELDWKRRVKVIHGTARGLQYLQEDSRLRIIHRDLKASNILLDDEMNPKISDFGTARIFGYKQIEDNTEKIVGTFGYMSPKYTLYGIISDKLDIYSFGVLLMEIITGKKATRFNHGNRQFSLLTWVWESWCQGKCLNLVDQGLIDSCSPFEAMTRLHIALLCVQDFITNRPTASQIVHMLNNDKDLPQPNQPTFTFQNTLSYDHHQSPSDHVCSINEVTHTTIEAR